MQWINYHHLYYFRIIATEGSIARASEKLRLGQSTLSTQLKQLEDSVGKKLFERRNKKLVLTEAGKAALNYSNEIFRLGDEMVEVLNDRTSENQTHLQIGALDGVPKEIILSLVLKAQSIAPCSISILEGKGDELLRELRAHRIDLIISNYPSHTAEETQMFSKSVGKFPVWVYGSNKYKDLKKAFPKSLSGKPFVLPTIHSQLRHDLNHYFKINNIEISTIAETQDTSLQKLLAENGVGLAPLSKVTKSNDKNLFCLGKLNGVFEEVWLISAHRKLENPIAAKLVNTFSLSKT